MVTTIDLRSGETRGSGGTAVTERTEEGRRGDGGRGDERKSSCLLFKPVVGNVWTGSNEWVHKKFLVGGGRMGLLKTIVDKTFSKKMGQRITILYIFFDPHEINSTIMIKHLPSILHRCVKDRV